MSIDGDLRDFQLAELLQFLAGARKSGKLELTRGRERGVIVLRRGWLIYAASGSAKETLGHMALSRGLISAAQLRHALHRHRAEPERRLGALLVEMGALSQGILELLVTQQIDGVIGELLRWPDGRFRFSSMEIEERGEVEVQAHHLHFDQGLDTGGVLLRVSASHDEDRTRRFARAGGAASAAAPPRRTLRSILSEVPTPAFTGEVTDSILTEGGKLVRRAVMLAVRGDSLCGIGQFGLALPGGDAEEAVRRIRLPLDQPSLAAAAARARAPRRAIIPEGPWDRYLLDRLGSGSPREAIALPLIADGRVLLVLYADDYPRLELSVRAGRLPLILERAATLIEQERLERGFGGEAGRSELL